jgi:hypothetical protein
VTNDDMKASEKRLNGTVRFAGGRVVSDRAMQTQDGVKRALRDHADLAAAKNRVRNAEVI